jgi:hypothetical protein
MGTRQFTTESLSAVLLALAVTTLPIASCDSSSSTRRQDAGAGGMLAMGGHSGTDAGGAMTTTGGIAGVGGKPGSGGMTTDGGAGGRSGMGGNTAGAGGSSGGAGGLDAAADAHECIITDAGCVAGIVLDGYGCPVCAPPPSGTDGSNDTNGRDGAGGTGGKAEAGVDGANLDGTGADKGEQEVPLDAARSPDGQVDARTLVVPCPGNASAPIWSEQYACGTCESDMGYPLACVDGQLACATSYVGSSGNVIHVPHGQYVVAKEDVMTRTGRCAYLATYDFPGFVLADPSTVVTDRDSALPLVLRAVSSSPQVRPAFSKIFEDRSKGETAIRSLVTLTDMTKNSSVAYTIGIPTEDPSSAVESLTLQPAAPLAANTWYRVTVHPAETQHLVNCHTFDRTSLAWLQTPETTDLYTYSRPMVADMAIASKGDAKGYVQFDFTEWLSSTDLTAHPAATVAVDGVELSGCISPYACSGSTPTQVGSLRLNLQAIPTAFTEIVLRVPHAIKSIKGGTILDGTVGNPHAKIDGDWAVYTFKAAGMVLTDSNLVRRWYHDGI